MNYEWELHAVVPHGRGERLAAAARKAGARGGTILVGRGENSSPVLRFLELAEYEKDVLVVLVSAADLDRVWDALKAEADGDGKKSKGILYAQPSGRTQMEADNGHELITVIVNRGYAEDIMDRARKAGAKGGTILHARGTGKPEDEKFFGVAIVPEKEEVLILADTDNSAAIQEAILALPCLTTPGIGIMYATRVSRFAQLGR